MPRLMRLDDNGRPIGTSLVETKNIVFDGTSGNGAIAAAATLSTNLTGANNDLTFTAVATDASGNDITIAYVDPEEIDAVLAVSVEGSAITVSLATDGDGLITSTAALIDAAIDGDVDAAALVTPANKAANDGTGVVTAMAATALSGGTTGYVRLFSVTGHGRFKIPSFCDVSLTGATAEFTIGNATVTDQYGSTITATNLDAGEIVSETGIEIYTEQDFYFNGADINLYISTAAIESGELTVYCQWEPFSNDALVEAA